MAPHPSGLPHPGLALGGGSGLLALSGALGAQLASKDERAHLEAVAAAAAAEHHRGITHKSILKYSSLTANHPFLLTNQILAFGLRLAEPTSRTCITNCCSYVGFELLCSKQLLCINLEKYIYSGLLGPHFFFFFF